MRPLAVNVGFLFRELPYLARFAAAREAGFELVEFAWPPVPAEAVAAAVRRARIGVALLNVDAGDLEAGERGFSSDPGSVDRWRAAFDAALLLAEAVACPVLNVLAGDRLETVSREAQLACFRRNLDWALPRARSAGRTLTIELLNPDDTPRYLMTDPDDLVGLLRGFDDPLLRLQFDTYHVGRILGPDAVAATFRDVAPLVGHVQVADVPGRHEPGTGSIDWTAFFEAIDASGYTGAIGLEYVPAVATLDALARTTRTLGTGGGDRLGHRSPLTPSVSWGRRRQVPRLPAASRRRRPRCRGTRPG